MGSFFLLGHTDATLLQSDYDLRLVALSFAIAVIASTTALQVATLARTARLRSYRHISIATGALALGGGVWSMHFIGMVALQVCFHVRYDLGLSVASMIPALIAAAIALRILSRDEVHGLQLLAGGAVVGTGIGVMHYAGMLSMQMTPLLRFDPLPFLISIVAAVLLATFALWIRFGLHRSGVLSEQRASLLAGLLMGAAITSMHYLGMSSARFIGVNESATPVPVQEQIYFADIVGLVAVVIGLAVLGGNTILKYRMAVQHLRSSEARLQAMFNTAVDGIVTIDRNGLIQSINRSAQKMLGYEAAQLIGQNVSKLMPEPYRGEHDGYLRNYNTGGAPRIIGTGREVVARHRDGTQIPVRLAVGKVQDSDSPLFVGFLTDISELKRAQAIREHEANHDALTELPNRRAFYLLLDAAMQRKERMGEAIALLFIDLDGFKTVNDTLGHAAGDALLIEIAQRLRTAVRRSDTVARLGGDEFVLILEGLNRSAEDATALAEKVLLAVAEPVAWHGHALRVGASIGISCLAPGLAVSVDTLVTEADGAMYEAKRGGRGRVCLAPDRVPPPAPLPPHVTEPAQSQAA